MHELDDLLDKLTRRLLAAEGRIGALERHETVLPPVMGRYLALPGLRGFWPMSAFDSNGDAQDVSGHAHHLTYNGDPTYSVDGLAPYIDLDGAGDYLSRADEADLDITGTESYMSAPGLTIGGWFRHDALGSVEALIGKDSPGQRSYLLWKTSSGNPNLLVSNDGSSVVTFSSSVTLSTDTWYFIAGRFIPSSELKVWVNATPATQTSSIPSSIFNGAADFSIGSHTAGSDLFDGRASLCFLCAAAVPDAIITNLFESTRHLFGV